MTHHWRTRLLDAVHLPISLYLLYYGADTLATQRGPAALERAIPDWLTLAWATALIVGGLLVIYGTATDRTRAESSGHAFHLAGIGLFTVANVAVFGLGDVVTVTVLAAVAVLRMRVLTRSRAARREAHRLNGGWQ